MIPLSGSSIFESLSIKWFPRSRSVPIKNRQLMLTNMQGYVFYNLLGAIDNRYVINSKFIAYTPKLVAFIKQKYKWTVCVRLKRMQIPMGNFKTVGRWCETKISDIPLNKDPWRESDNGKKYRWLDPTIPRIICGIIIQQRPIYSAICATMIPVRIAGQWTKIQIYGKKFSLTPSVIAAFITQ